MSCTRKLFLYQPPLEINAQQARDIIDIMNNPKLGDKLFHHCDLSNNQSKLRFNYAYLRLKFVIKSLREYFIGDIKSRSSDVRDDLKQAFNMLMEFFKSKILIKPKIKSPMQINNVLGIGLERKDDIPGESKRLNELPSVLEDLILGYRAN